MGPGDRVRRALIARAQPYVDAPVIAAANFTWPVSWSTPSSAQSHPEWAGGLPEVILMALTEADLHLLAPPVGRISHGAKAGPLTPIGSWPRWQVRVVRLDKPTMFFGREMVTLPRVELTLPGREPALLAGAQGATPVFTRELFADVPPPALRFGDGVTLLEPDGRETVGRYLAGPVVQDGHEIYWACDWHEWDIATVREGRDPTGTAYPVDRVRFSS